MRKWISKQWKRRPRPLRFLWRWAKRPKKGQSVLKRFIALREWAAHREEEARKRKDWKAFRRWHKIRVRYKRQVRRKRKWLEDHKPDPPPKGAGTTMIDGRAVPNWMVPKLKEIRNRGRWGGLRGFGLPDPRILDPALHEHVWVSDLSRKMRGEVFKPCVSTVCHLPSRGGSDRCQRLHHLRH